MSDTMDAKTDSRILHVCAEQANTADELRCGGALATCSDQGINRGKNPLGS